MEVPRLMLRLEFEVDEVLMVADDYDAWRRLILREEGSNMRLNYSWISMSSNALDGRPNELGEKPSISTADSRSWHVTDLVWDVHPCWWTSQTSIAVIGV
jgi:hypothetical protein